jgi:hypothetical protein
MLTDFLFFFSSLSVPCNRSRSAPSKSLPACHLWTSVHTASVNNLRLSRLCLPFCKFCPCVYVCSYRTRLHVHLHRASDASSDSCRLHTQFCLSSANTSLVSCTLIFTPAVHTHTHTHTRIHFLFSWCFCSRD